MAMTNELYHEAALLDESIETLSVRPSGTYVDATYGGGGHAQRILDSLAEDGRLIAFDKDEDAPVDRFAQDARFSFHRADFRYMKNILRYHEELPVDGILADLGVSSHHFDTPDRGFSTRIDGPLDMRMDPRSGESAADLLNKASQEELARIFHEYGELQRSRKLARILVEARERGPIESTGQLRELLEHRFPPEKREGELAKVFQALRIKVNRETEALEDLLKSTPDMIREGGRLVVLSYHSLEDRLVKRFLHHGNFSREPEKDEKGNWERPFRPVLKKPITPGEEETKRNPRARSAKLRAGERNQAST